jgi:hypothetical protein
MPQKRRPIKNSFLPDGDYFLFVSRTGGGELGSVGLVVDAEDLVLLRRPRGVQQLPRRHVPVLHHACETKPTM